MKTILVVAAHPDDEVLGCGGAMARFATEGNELYTLILGEGITSRYLKRKCIESKKELNDLKKQIADANQILGVKKTYAYDFPDNRFDTVPLLNIVKNIEEVKAALKPDIIFTHHYGDLNVDHQLTFKAVITASRPIKGETAKSIFSFEVPSSTEWNAPLSPECFKPNYFIDISKTFKIKTRAMSQYKSELRSFPHPRSIEAIETMAKLRGIQVGLKCAEAFEVVRLIVE